MSNFDLVLKLFLQLTVILAACRAVGAIGRRLGQTQVVCEMITGVLLGPSLFGIVAPDAQKWLFPTKAVVGGVTMAHPSMSILYAMSQVGLVLYMFLVGLEFDTSLIKGKLRSAGLISASGIIVPFFLGGLLAFQLRGKVELFAPGISPLMAALYMGAAMSITAFPMLARILDERGITKTRIGTVSLAAGSLDDALAWVLLALILASVKSSPMIAWMAIGGTVIYVLGMTFVGRPFLSFFERWAQRDGELSTASITLLLGIIMLCAWTTDAVGVYAVFGAFICGTAMPRGKFSELVRKKMDLLTTSLLLPIFFVYSGLNTRIDLLNNSSLIGIAAIIIAIAIIGKGVACALAARAGGENWREAWTIGTLMNARGLMELIILNIGREKGLINDTLFTIMVLMAIVTTVMASPIFQWIYGRHMPKLVPQEAEAAS